MSRHRSPRGRHGSTRSWRNAVPADRRSLTIGLVAFTSGALVLLSAALVAGPTDEPSPIAAGVIEPAPAVPAPTLPEAGPPSAGPEEPALAVPGDGAGSTTPTAKKPASGSPARSGVGTKLAQTDCAKRASDAAGLSRALATAAPGDRICATGSMGASRLQVTRSGTAASPIVLIGDGNTTVKGITVEASHVVVDGFNSVGGKAPGILMEGNNITMQNNKVSRPTGGDYDGLRFFGNNLKILNNRISDIDPGGSGAHADCMQTFQNDTPSSKNVVISGNRCERVDNMCLMAEGPGDLGDGGAGEGESSNWTFSNNYCDTNASQALMIEAVQNVTVTGNNIVGKVDKAFAFDIGSTGAKVASNKIAPGIGYEVGMDSSSRKGYQGPAVGGGP